MAFLLHSPSVNLVIYFRALQIYTSLPMARKVNETVALVKALILGGIDLIKIIHFKSGSIEKIMKKIYSCRHYGTSSLRYRLRNPIHSLFRITAKQDWVKHRDMERDNGAAWERHDTAGESSESLHREGSTGSTENSKRSHHWELMGYETLSSYTIR